MCRSRMIEGASLSADDRRKTTHLAADYALDLFGGLKEVGAALEDDFARLAREYRQNNAYGKFLGTEIGGDLPYFFQKASEGV